MRTILLLLVFIALGNILSCNKNEDMDEIQFESTGVIMGSDGAFCACCGGWILKIDNDENIYRIEELPESSEIELSETFLDVMFNWSIDRECNSIIYITIEDIELI